MLANSGHKYLLTSGDSCDCIRCIRHITKLLVYKRKSYTITELLSYRD